MTDPLSDLLEMVHARSAISGRMIAGGEWARRFANLNAIKFCAAIEGKAWWFMEGMAEPLRFEAGDILVMNGTRPLILASTPGLIRDAENTPLFRDEAGIYRLGRGEDFIMLGGAVTVDERRQPLLLAGLPPVLVVSSAANEASTLGWLLKQLLSELELQGRPGHTIVIAELAQLLFVKTLRAYLMHAPGNDGGWLKGLGDKKLAPALSRMHSEPARNWNLEELAQAAGMPRTSFAVRFRRIMGIPPLTYLTTWRMHIAERDLRTGASIAEIAEAVGYKSESAFSHAFKRIIGVAPGRCRWQQTFGETRLPLPHAEARPFRVVA
ncbi:Transcriptional regulator, AraC family [Sphingobium indicum BiD32]|uniref:Transcriptional regulator, AraC family n=1 Tax=Sphingobium indicum BiD32 TaxID=1301087 RepID=N1MPA5_9SPHN|nr:AraC family transcriptional regulator [Sphingobium indicum]CCW19060.1 Transcriptional regulator, AraC family [Sphingobium indicum BiD32]